MKCRPFLRSASYSSERIISLRTLRARAVSVTIYSGFAAGLLGKKATESWRASRMSWLAVHNQTSALNRVPRFHLCAGVFQMARKRAVDTARPVQRRVYFYTQSGGKKLDIPKLFAAASSWAASEQLDFEIGEDDKRLACRIDHTTWPIRVSFGHVRLRNLPGLMNLEGDERPIDADDNEGVSDRTRIVFFQSGVVGCELNVYGPRFESLFVHLAKKPNLAVQIGSQVPQFKLLLRDDAIERLEQLGGLTLLRIRAHRALGKAVSNSIAKDIDQLASQHSSDTVEIVLRGEPYAKSTLGDGIKDAIKKFVGIPSARTQIEKLEVKGLDPETGRQIPIDLLKDKLVTVTDIVPENPRTRTLRCSDVFAAIEKGYLELKAQLDAAAKDVS